MDDEDSPLVQENLIEKLFAGMDPTEISKMDPENVRSDVVLDISKLPKLEEPQQAIQGWIDMKRLNLHSEKQIQEI